MGLRLVHAALDIPGTTRELLGAPEAIWAPSLHPARGGLGTQHCFGLQAPQARVSSIVPARVNHCHGNKPHGVEK